MADEARFPGPGDWLVLKYKNGGLWYRADARGYTFSLLEAGVYTEAQAKHHAFRSAGEVVAVEFGSQMFKDHLKRNNRLAEWRVLVALAEAREGV